MLHILFLILKIIGIILAVILGILVLLVSIVLFVPVSYQGSAKCDGTVDSLCGILKVSWLFHIVSVNAKYENGNLRYSIRIAWKKIAGGKKREKLKEKLEEETNTEEPSVESSSDQEAEKIIEESKEKLESIEQKVEERSSVFEKSEESDKSSEKTDSPVKEKNILKNKIKNNTTCLKEKLTSVCGKIKCTIKNICDKLKLLLEKKDKVMRFIQDKNHIKAFLKIKKECLKMLRRLCPKKYIIKARYGFDDPSLTGKVLAMLSILYLFTEEHMEIVPDFDNKILQGRVMIKGRIYIIYFVCTAWNLVWCKQVRMLYKDVRNFKL